MTEREAKQWIIQLRWRTVLMALINIFLRALAVAILLSATAIIFSKHSYWTSFFSLLLAFIGWSIYIKDWRIDNLGIAKRLDRRFAQLEESTTLLFKDKTALSFLERLQLEKITMVAGELKPFPTCDKRLMNSLGWLFSAGVLSLCLIYFASYRPVVNTKLTPLAAIVGKGEKLPARVSELRVQIVPPAYTGKVERRKDGFSISAEKDAQVSWQLRTSSAVKKLGFIFNDHPEIPLRSLNKEKTLWAFSQQVVKSGFYQVSIDGIRSDFYQIEVIPDHPVVINVLHPAAYLTIDIGAAQVLGLKVMMKDDYGISDAYIAATLTSGKGESVTFKEKKIAIDIPATHPKQLQLVKNIALEELGMKPADELYYEIHARDNHGQWSRSGMFLVSIQDTTELLSMAGMDSGLSLVPEYFRSQRQLIIDTEKLIKERKGISDAEFKSRSNSLGEDQKMLRLRYGKFLGEEDEQGHEHEEHVADRSHAEKPVSMGRAADVLSDYAHKHDQAEDATFFEPELKTKLKATLTEMWNSELHLRTYKLLQALPFEYKALRLLKDLQQQSRVYVAKTTFKPSVLKPEKRLSADLSQIKMSVTQARLNLVNTRFAVLKETLELIEGLKTKQGKSNNGSLTTPEIRLLLQSERYLMAAAITQPQRYLAALKVVKKTMSKHSDANEDELLTLQSAIAELIGDQPSIPGRKTKGPSATLSTLYFHQLKRLIVENGK